MSALDTFGTLPRTLRGRSTRLTAPISVLYVDVCQGRGGATAVLADWLRHLPAVRPVIMHALPADLADVFAEFETVAAPHWDVRQDYTRAGAPRATAPEHGRLRLARQLGMDLWRSTRRIVDVARTCGAQIIHGNNDIAGNLPAILAARWLGIPCVLSERVFQANSRLARRIARLATCHITVSASVAEHLVEWGIPAKKIAVIYDGWNVSQMCPPRPPAAEVVVGAVGRFVPWKGMLVAVEAAMRVAPELANARFVIVGGPAPEAPEDWERVRGAVADHPAADRIALLGDRPDAWQLMQEMDILLHTAVQPEPGARVLHEGLAAGCAVVTTACGGSPEICADGAGSVLPPGDVDALAAEIRRLVTDVAARRALQEAGQQRLRAHLDLQAAVKRLEAVYAACLDRR